MINNHNYLMYRGYDKQIFHGFMENREYSCPKGEALEVTLSITSFWADKSF